MLVFNIHASVTLFMKTHTYIVVPAAGTGTRLHQSLPKQYAMLAGQAILTHTLTTLLAIPDVQQLIIALAADDTHFDALITIDDARLSRVIGGASRAESVLSALNHLTANDDDWVLIHDAARPLISLNDIAKLRMKLAKHPVGGILATPVTDTLKHVDQHGTIQHTVNRKTLWRALTPQMCRYGVLKQALTQCLLEQQTITDEAMALERCGYSMQIIEGSATNIKITYPIDLLVAEQLIKATFKA